MKKVLIGLLVGLGCGVQAAIVTNTWIGATGGSWTNAANWSDPVMLGTNEATCAFFDLSALPSGATNSIPYFANGIRAYGLLVGSDEGAETDTWLFTREGAYANWSTLIFRFVGDDSGVGRLDVRRGVLRLDGQVNGGAVVLKTGPGTVRLVASENGNWRIAEGTVVPANDKALWKSYVRLTGNDGLLDANYWGSGVELLSLLRDDGVTTPMPLNGGQIYFGASGTSTTLEKDYFSGSGTISSHGDQVLALTSSLPSFTGTFRLENGDITMSPSLPGLEACYAFEDAAQVGVSTPKGPTLVAQGSPQVVADAERGNVLSFNGSSYLASADATKLPDGFPLGANTFTIGFWVKLDADVPAQATLFYLGKWNEVGTCLLIRLEKSKNQVMFTNYGNNTPADCASLFDGNWHHLAVQYTVGSGQESLYFDGAKIATSWTTPAIQDGEFWIGTGKNNNNFKGLMDDFVVSSGIVDPSALMSGLALSELSPVLNPAVSIAAHGSGTLNLYGTQTVAQISGDIPTARIRLDGGLRVTGTQDALKTTYPAEITGTGDFVKDGADYDLTLSGANSYTGVTRVVAGTLGVEGRKTIGTLVGNWTFEDTADLGRDSGDAGFNLTVSGATAYDDATRGHVVRFNGQAKLSSTALPDAFPSGDSDYTLSLWLKGESSCGATAGVCVWGTTGSNGQCALWRLDGTTGWMMTNWGNNHLSETKANNFRDGQWHQVVWVRKGTQMVVYVDGERAESWNTALALDVQKTSFTLGMNPASSQYFTGLMDDVRLYAFALTEDEAKAEFTGAIASSDRSNMASSRPDPLYRWTFEDETDPGANTGSAADGALSVVGSAHSAVVGDRSGRVLDLRGVQADGSTVISYLEAAAYPASIPTTNQAFTVCCWARMTYYSESATWLYWGNPDGYFMLFGSVNDGQFRCTLDVKGNEVASGVHTLWTPATENKWHHLAATYDGTYLRIYEDGIQVAAKWVGAINMGASKFWIGRKASSTTDWFHGYLDDVEIYDSALSTDQIRSIVRAERNRADEPVLPADAVVDVSAGATFRVAADDLAVSQVTGEGVLDVREGATLGVTQPTTFNGTLKGMGSFGLADGVTIETDATLAGLPLLTAPQAAVTIPASGTVHFDCAAKDVPLRTITLATGASVVAPSDFSGWTVEPALPATVRFETTPTAFTVKILSSGTMFLVR